MKILLIGTGRAAFHLGHGIRRSHHDLVGIAGRNMERARVLATDLNTEPVQLNEAFPDTDLLLIAVSDDAIADVALHIPLGDAVVAHTSGAGDLDKLLPHPDRGVLWPLISLSPGEPMDLAQVPMVIDGNSERARITLKELATALSTRVSELDHGQRELVHAAAAISLNLPTYLLARSQKLLKDQGIDPDIIVPAFAAMARRVEAIGALKALTGPARRGDVGTIHHHLDRLTEDPELRAAYARLSSMILRAHGHPDDGLTDL